MTRDSDIAREAARRLADTVKAQLRASEPTTSAWVSANAGAGKTHVLKMRVLRLLLADTAPSRILCLTYTKAAAAEMSSRVFAELAQWAGARDDELQRLVTELLGRRPEMAELVRARQLFALAVETPGGLKVQTIHAFCEKLLQRFPLEAGVAPGFRILDEELSAEIRASAIADTLQQGVADPQSAVGRALATIAARVQGERFDLLISSALAKRAWLTAAAAIAEPTDKDRDVAALHEAYCKAFGARPDADIASLEDEMTKVLRVTEMRSFATILAVGGKTDIALSEGLNAAAATTSDAARLAALRDVFLTKDGFPRSDQRFITKKLRSANSGMTDRMIAARDRFHALTEEAVAVSVAEASVALAVFADSVLKGFKAGKDARAALDFDDLILRTADLLANTEEAAWVLYKLDGGLDHILVDEAQDTSEVQWRVVQGLAGEFFTGDGNSEITRTIFAVGDEKQSIYSFQGAAPEMFRDTGAAFARAAKDAGRTLVSVPLELSFRTVEPLLEAVDQTFADPTVTPGVGAGGKVRHHARRLGQAGLLEIWPTEKPNPVAPTHAFDPLDDTTPSTPVVRLAARIADTIGQWLDNGERLASANREVRAGDIIVLLRRRRPLGPAIVAALKKRRIPVAGADRIALTQQIAVQDLMALFAFLLLPEDDLSLACVMKSPLFNFNDDDLLRLAPKRPGILWSALLEAAKLDTRYDDAVSRLKRWRARADFLPPFEFLAWLLDNEGVRTAMLSRLGAEAADVIDELVNLALTYDEDSPPSLQGFLAWLERGNREIKRDAEHGRNEVRVMTVHGAKGLEAPIVFLPDTCSGPAGGSPPPLVMIDSASPPTAGVWAIKSARNVPAITAARVKERARATEEYQRLLYVAMTRARDRLYVTGVEGKRAPPDDAWYTLIRQSLDGQLTQHKLADGREIHVLSSQQTAEPEPAKADGPGVIAAAPLPGWALCAPPREIGLTIPLAPSRLAPLDSDDDGEPIEPVANATSIPREPRSPVPRALATDNRFLRGTVIHALLEHLPELPVEQWPEAARRFVDRRAAELSNSTRTHIVREALGVLRDSEFGAVFGPDSQAEVAIAAEIRHSDRPSHPLRIAGQIDRLVIRESDVLIVDFKTNRPPPTVPKDVPTAYLLQLAAYRLAMQQLADGKEVRAALLWTDGPRLMEIPGDLLREAESELWAHAGARLDG